VIRRSLLLATTWLAVAAGAQPAPPAALLQLVPQARWVGSGPLTYWGLPIYDASLWAAPGFSARDHASHAFGLELLYRRSFKGTDIAQRSLTEMARQGALDASRSQRWLRELQRILPDVKEGDRLLGIHLPGAGMRLVSAAREPAAVDDTELAARFFGIWLAPTTSEPELRRALLAQAPA